jgi:hypothetical protein
MKNQAALCSAIAVLIFVLQSDSISHAQRNGSPMRPAPGNGSDGAQQKKGGGLSFSSDSSCPFQGLQQDNDKIGPARQSLLNAIEQSKNGCQQLNSALSALNQSIPGGNSGAGPGSGMSRNGGFPGSNSEEPSDQQLRQLCSSDYRQQYDQEGLQIELGIMNPDSPLLGTLDPSSPYYDCIPKQKNQAPRSNPNGVPTGGPPGQSGETEMGGGPPPGDEDPPSGGPPPEVNPPASKPPESTQNNYATMISCVKTVLINKKQETKTKCLNVNVQDASVTSQAISTALNSVSAAMNDASCTDQQVKLTGLMAALNAASQTMALFGGPAGVIASGAVNIVGSIATVVKLINDKNRRELVQKLENQKDSGDVACLFFYAQNLNPETGACERSSQNFRYNSKAQEIETLKNKIESCQKNIPITDKATKDLIKLVDALNQHANEFGNADPAKKEAGTAAVQAEKAAMSDKSSIQFFNSLKKLDDSMKLELTLAEALQEIKKDPDNADLNLFYNRMSDLKKNLEQVQLKTDPKKNPALSDEQIQLIKEKLSQSYLNLNASFPSQKKGTVPGWMMFYRQTVQKKPAKSDADDPLVKFAQFDQDLFDVKNELIQAQTELASLGTQENRAGDSIKDLFTGLQGQYRSVIEKSFDSSLQYFKENNKSSATDPMAYERKKPELMGAVHNMVNYCASISSIYEYKTHEGEMGKKCKKILGCFKQPSNRGSQVRQCFLQSSAESMNQFFKDALFSTDEHGGVLASGKAPKQKSLDDIAKHAGLQLDGTCAKSGVPSNSRSAQIVRNLFD